MGLLFHVKTNIDSHDSVFADKIIIIKITSVIRDTTLYVLLVSKVLELQWKFIN